MRCTEPVSHPAEEPSAERPPGQPSGQPSEGGPDQAPRRTGGRNQLLLFTLGALVLGLVLGGVIVGLSRPSTPVATGPAPDTAETVSPGSTSTANPGDVQLAATVPQQCLDAADQASTALRTAQSGLTAIADLDAARLRDILRELQDAQPLVSDLADQCRSQAQGSVSRQPTPPPPTDSPAPATGASTPSPS